MKKIWKKILSLTLAVVMVIGMVPAFELEAQALEYIDYTWDDTAQSQYGNFLSFWDNVTAASDKNNEVRITLAKDVTFEGGRLLLEDDERVSLYMKGYDLTRTGYTAGVWPQHGQVFRLMDESRLDIFGVNSSTDPDDRGVIGGGKCGGSGGAFYLDEETQLYIYDAVIADNKCIDNGSAIYAEDDAVIDLSGVEIYNNRSAEIDAGPEGGTIYCTDDVRMKLYQVNIHDNSSTYGYGGGIFWGSDDESSYLTNVTITNNSCSADGGGIFVASGSGELILHNKVVISGNKTRNGFSYDFYAQPNNLHLEDDSANITTMTLNNLRGLGAGSSIGITYGDYEEDPNDCITAEESMFTEEDIKCFFSDDPDNVTIRKVDTGDEEDPNRWRLYATKNTDPNNELPHIAMAAIRGSYAAATDPVVIDRDAHTAVFTVKNDIVTKRFLSNASLIDLVSITFSCPGTVMPGSDHKYDSTYDANGITRQYKIKTPNGTYEYWNITLKPEGDWPYDDARVAYVSYTKADGNGGSRYYYSFDEAWQAAIGHAIDGDATTFRLEADWLAGDTNSNGIIDTNETAGDFKGVLSSPAAAYSDGALYAHGNLIIDLNGHKIDRMLWSHSGQSRGNGHVIRVGNNGNHAVTIKDSVGTGAITGGYSYNSGGGIHADDPTALLHLENVTISGNFGGIGGGIYAKCATVLKGCTIKDNWSSNGGGIFWDNPNSGDMLSLLDTDIINNNSNNFGGGIYSRGAANIIMLDNQNGDPSRISNNSVHTGSGDGGLGGGVYLDGYGDLLIYNGEISGNMAVKSGGGVYVSVNSFADITMNAFGAAQYIRDNTAVDGGGIYYNGNGQIYLNDSNYISNNTATNNGGGLYIKSGVLNLKGGYISSNTAKNGGGIYSHGGSVDMQDGYIMFNTADLGGGIYWMGDALNDSSSWADGGGVARLYGGSISSNSKVGVYIHGENNSEYDPGRIYLGGTIKIINNAKADELWSYLEESCDHNNVLLADRYVNIYHDTEHPLTSGAEIGICMPSSAPYSKDEDASKRNYGDDLIDQISAESANFGEFSYQYLHCDNYLFSLDHIDGGEDAGANRWQLHLATPYSTYSMDPTIETATVIDLYAAGMSAVVDKENYVVTLYVNNDAAGKNRVAFDEISLDDFATFTYAREGSYIIDSDKDYNFVTTPERKFRVMTKSRSYADWTIRVYPNEPWGDYQSLASVTVDGVTTTFSTADSFTEAWQFARSESDNKGKPATLTLHRDWLAGDTNNNGQLEPDEEDGTASNFGDSYGDYNKFQCFMDCGDIIIDLNGYTIDRKGGHRVFNIFGDARLTIKDSVGGGKITGGNSDGGGVFKVHGNAVLTLESGTITDSKANWGDKLGGAIYAEGNAQVIMNGGTITGNKANNGGAIYAKGNARVIMNGGTINSNDFSAAGGAVYIDGKAQMTMNGGTISSNVGGSGNGGGVYVNSGSFILNGGSIIGNLANNGGGVYVNGGSFYMNGGYVENNSANNHGGGIYVMNGGKLVTTGGSVRNNNANYNGGGIAFEKVNDNGQTNCTLKNITVSGNEAKLGGGIAYIGCTDNTMRMENVTVSGNTARENGGGIHVNPAENKHVTIVGSSVLNNTASGSGGGIYYANGVLNLVDSTVRGNSAGNKGGGVFVWEEKEVDVYLGGAAVIDGNTAGGIVSNLYLESEDNDILPYTSTPLANGARIGVRADYLDHDESDIISHSASNFAIGDGYYFYADNSSYFKIALLDNGKATNRYHIYLVGCDLDHYANATPGISSASPKYDSFKGSSAFASINARSLTLTVNKTYKSILSSMALNTFVNFGVSSGSSILGVDTVQNFPANPSKVYQIMHEDDWYSLWTINVLPEGGEWSNAEGCVASVTTPNGTKLFYDMGMAYEYAYTNSKYPGGATLKLNQNWVGKPGEDEGFYYEDSDGDEYGTNYGRLYLNDSNINLTIDLNGYTINRNAGNSKVDDGQVFRIAAGSLTIMDSSAVQTGTITGGKNDGDGGAFYMDGGQLTINGGNITNNQADEYGGAIYMCDDARLVMNGGKITGNYINNYGGGVFMEDEASFTMNGGEISGNRVNDADDDEGGGGLYMEDDVVFTMNGGSISNNVVSTSGTGGSIGRGGGIYVSDWGSNVQAIIWNGTISGNEAAYGGGIYWLGDGSGRLTLNGGEIINNRATTGQGGGVYADDDGTDPYVGGTIRITGNTDGSGNSNLYLESDDSNLNQNTGYKLRDGAQIGVRFGYEDDDDYFSAEDSYFDENSAAYFMADNPDYLVRVRLSGTGGNAYKLYLTHKDSSAASNAQADIVGAVLKADYASTKAPVLENYTALIPVNADFYFDMAGGAKCMNDVLTLKVNQGAAIVDAAPLNAKGDLTEGVSVKVRAPDSITVATWLVKVVPDSDSGEWNRYTVDLTDAVFVDNGTATEATSRSIYPGETVSIKPNTSETEVFRSWIVTDMDVTDIEMDENGIATFTMPRNNVAIAAQYYDQINTAAITLAGEVKGGIANTNAASYYWNDTQQGMGSVAVRWTDKSTGADHNDIFGFNKTYTVTVTIDLSSIDSCRVGPAPTATINGQTAVVTRVSDTVLQAQLDFATPAAKVTSLQNTVSFQSTYMLPANGDASVLLNDAFKEMARSTPTVSVVTEDPNITTVDVTWNTRNSTYNSTDKVFTFYGTVSNSALDFGSFSKRITAKVYLADTVLAAAPVITFEQSDSDAAIKYIDITSATENATILYTTNGLDPAGSVGNLYNDTKIYNSGNKPTVVVEPGTRKTVTVKAIAREDGRVDSPITSVTKTFSRPYAVTGLEGVNYVLEGNDGFYQNETTTIRITPDAGKRIKSITVTGGATVSSNSDTVTVINPTGDITVTVVQEALVKTIEISALTLTPGSAFPTFTAEAKDADGNEVASGCTATIDWNTNHTKVAYGATYYPTICVTAAAGSYPFAAGFTVTHNGSTVYTSSSTTTQHTFNLTLAAPKAKLTNVIQPGDVTMNQGESLSLPQTVGVTADGNVITTATVNWDLTNFDANVAAVYTISGTLVLPANVDPNGKGTVQITVTVNALPQLAMPGADSRTEDVDKTIADDTKIKVRATVVELIYTGAANPTIYYTLDGNDPSFDTEGKPTGSTTAYDPATGIVLDTDGTYTIRAVAAGTNYITSAVATFTYVVTAPQVYTVRVYDWVNGTAALAKTVSAAVGETVTFTADSSLGYFDEWIVDDNKMQVDPNDSNSMIPDNTWENATFNSAALEATTLSFTMPESNVAVTAVYTAPIRTVEISGVEVVAYKAFGTIASSKVSVVARDEDGTAKTTEVTSTAAVTWMDGETPADTTATYGKTYTGTIILQPDEGKNLIYAENVAVTGLTGAENVKATVNADGTVTVTFKMTAVAVKMSADYQVTESNVLTVEYNTTEEQVIAKLPTTLNIPTEAGMIPVTVTWSCDSYNAAAEGSYIFTADLATKLAALGIDSNGHTVSAQVTVRVAAKPAATFVAIPTVDVTPGTYAANQTVALSCATEDAEIYYTVGTNATPADPTTDGAVYSSAISLPGTAGTTVTYIIKAAAKLNDTWSDIATYRYTVSIPATKYTVTVNNWAIGNTATVKTVSAAAGETVTITADSSKGSFGKWIVDGSITDATDLNAATLSFTMPAGNVTVTAVYITPISTVEISGVDVPVAYKAFDTTAAAEVTVVTRNDDGTAQITDVTNNVAVTWMDGENPAATTAAYGTTYTGTITLVPDKASGIVYASGVAVTGLTGATATVNADGSVTVTFTMTPAKVMMNADYQVTAANNIYTVENGTAESALGLPTTLNIPTEAGMISVADVVWSCSTEGGYKKDTAGDYIFTANLSDTFLNGKGIDRNNYTVSAQVTVRVAAPEVTFVAIPTVNVTPGTYAAEQNVALSCTTENAVIYYTYTNDGTVPADPKTGAVYSSAISLPGTAGTTVTYIIKAAAKVGETWSDIATYLYTISIPATKYTVTVNEWVNGNTTSETMEAAAGETVTITADSSKGSFGKWIVDGSATNVTDLNAATLSFTMPASDVTVTAVYITPISTVEISGVDVPVAYKAFDTTASSKVSVVTRGENGDPVPTEVTSTAAVTWSPAADTAAYGTDYTGTITLQPDKANGIVYAENVAVTGLTGATATVNADGSVTVTFEMTAEMVKMSADYQVTESNVLTVEYNTTEEQVKAKLPTTLNIPTEAGMIPVTVTWSCDSYNAAAEGSYIFTADLATKLAALGIDSNGHTVSAQVTVRVAAKPAATFVAIPAVNVTPGTYDTNQTVELSCTTENAVIYYTYTSNGTVPADPKTGTEYSSAISLPGTAGTTVTYIIKAAAKLNDTWSDIATYRYTVSIPAAKITVTVTGGTGGGEFLPGETVTIVANAPDAGKYFTGWTVGNETVSTDSTYTFTAPAGDVTYTANYADRAVTRIDVTVAAPVAGSALPATVSYDLTYNNGAPSRNNTATAAWTDGSASVSGTAERGKAYTLALTINCGVAPDSNLKFYFNGAEVTETVSDTTVTYSRPYPVLTAAYKSHANPAPIVNVAADKAFSEITLPQTVDVTAADGTTTSIAVDWAVPTGTIGNNQTVTITGKLRATGEYSLEAANITGGTNASVAVYVSSVAKQQVAAPAAIPVAGTEHFDSVTVTLSSGTNGAKIYYIMTTDGSTPDDPTTTSGTLYTGPITLTANATIKAIAVKDGMDNSIVSTFSYTVTTTYALDVVKGSGSGRYAEGAVVTVKANEDVDNYFTGWTAVDAEGNTVTLTYDDDNNPETEVQNVALNTESITFNMPANAVTLTANYASKINEVKIEVPALNIDGALPAKEDLTIHTGNITIEAIRWTPSGTVAYSTLYTAEIDIKAAENIGFAEHGNVYVNSSLVPSTIDRSTGVVTLIYQVLSSPDSYASHTPTSVDPITDVPYGTDLTTLKGDKLPTMATITTEGGRSYNVGIEWDFANSEYSTGRTDAYTFTLTGEIILPAGISGSNPTIEVEISVLAKPYVPYIPPVEEPIEISFIDVAENAYYYDAVVWAVQNGVTNGTTETTFSPNNPCTRAQAVTFLWRAAGCPEPQSTLMPFADIAADAYYYKAVLWAVENGVTNGTTETTFSPNKTCTRAQIVTFLWRSQNAAASDGSNPFTDVSAESYYAGAVNWAVENEITNGTTESTFSPANPCTRAQIVTFLYRCLVEQ